MNVFVIMDGYDIHWFTLFVEGLQYDGMVFGVNYLEMVASFLSLIEPF